ncbi:MAG: ureidoglycolate hydrolase [Pelagibacteraceae bacterium]|jgi:ureidoglycolate lyase|nr:ureidoglycolate hydrolase [Pelagibacteraceae bacterium]MBT3901996.1 ureidoglycolate hydrolase [Pelagibacteraceae bacterium]MBT4645543.1 ureidoglycolate hydrolase [Pelagibacteraceae bacterium]MBT4951812.1 ureidoglycolate hydrolase [Pelagibacteraceae bacterium]MBT5214212.1 ureidoglycolate hydrolase [Pelagibacteraceae bacterium]
MNYEIKKITKDNFSEFGDFINPYDKIGENINSNTTKSYFDLANIEILSEDKRVRLNLFDAKKRLFPLKIDMLENHPFSSQIFLPLGSYDFLVITCPASPKPNLKKINIFRVDQGNGINFKPQVWHFPLISFNDAKFITIDKKNDENNLEIYNFTEEETFTING